MLVQYYCLPLLLQDHPVGQLLGILDNTMCTCAHVCVCVCVGSANQVMSCLTHPVNFLPQAVGVHDVMAEVGWRCLHVPAMWFRDVLGCGSGFQYSIIKAIESCDMVM